MVRVTLTTHRPLAHFPGVSVGRGWGRLLLPSLRRATRLAVVAHQSLVESLGTLGLVENEQHALLVDGEGPEVGRLVMQDAKCEAVALLVRASRLEQPDVGQV